MGRDRGWKQYRQGTARDCGKTRGHRVGEVLELRRGRLFAAHGSPQMGVPERAYPKDGIEKGSEWCGMVPDSCMR